MLRKSNGKKKAPPAKAKSKPARKSTRVGRSKSPAWEVKKARAGHPQPVQGPLVLIVDDYEDAREMCSDLLRYYGFRTIQASTGIEAVEQATTHNPDIILMDLSLPGMDGWEATRRIKADERTRRIPVVALTGHALTGHSEKAMAAGCDSFVTKPVMPDDLLKEVRRILSLPAKQRSKLN